MVGTVLSATLGLSGCMSGGDNDVDVLALAAETDPPDVLYNQGLANLEGGRLGEASKKFEAIDRQHPYTEWARKALIMQAFASYRGGNYDDAETAAKRYIALYPDSDDAAYAEYIVGLSHYRQIPDVTRDQKQAAYTATAMRALMERFPDTAYAEDAKSKLRIARDQLAGKEMLVGRYYLERRDYLAAINRFKNVVDVYPDTRQVEEALARLTESYYAMGLIREAQASASVLGQNFPDSPWYHDSYTLLKGHGLEPREGASGSWFAEATKKITGAS
ncbi:outer membrane protein assembly factor BamD [Jiella sonneratiae]|uniref:Outer membrane protein assembly factor BamD n=1 Tax=Jiella sonneratiae TaxID=2816856 RepID=A0ABS3IY18_9HYPH|nr:outer membrane protein assembly factor BamD [Jiella sonneratiae]